MFDLYNRPNPFMSSPSHRKNEIEEESPSLEDTVDKHPSSKKKGKEPIPFFIFIASLIIVIVGTAFMLISSLHFVAETEEAVITCFGNPRTVSQSGLCFTIPFIEEFETVDKTIHKMPIGYTIENDDTVPAEASMITKDFNFLDVYFDLTWQVSDPIKYLYASQDPETILYNLVQSTIRDTVGTRLTDNVLTIARDEVQEIVHNVLVDKLEALDIGIIIHQASIQDVAPPIDQVKAAFNAVESAKTSVNTKVSEANKTYSEKTSEAKADADEKIQSAEADKAERINEAEGQVARFTSMYKQYLLAPEVTKLRMYYEAMEEILPNVKVIITNGNGEIVNVFTEPYSSMNTTTTPNSNLGGSATANTDGTASPSDTTASNSTN